MEHRPYSEGIQRSSSELDSKDDVVFYAVTDERFFIGAVGLINSLRLMGHEQHIVLLDCGLTEHQRSVLAPECELVVLPDAQGTNPQLLKPFATLLRTRGTVVVLDSDLIVTRPLDPVLEMAKNGRVCVCADPESERWFAEWEQIFGLSGTLRHQTYVSSGFVAFSMEHWPDLLPYWWESCERVRLYPTAFYEAPDSPTAQADQDALNAILMSRWPEETLAIQSQEVQPSMEQLRWHVRMLNIDTLSCSLHDRPVTLVHPGVKTKPFESQWWTRQGRNPYPALLRRLLVGQDIRVRVAHDDVPLWIRPGLLGEVVMRSLYMINRLGSIREWRFLRFAHKLLRRRLGGTRG